VGEKAPSVCLSPISNATHPPSLPSLPPSLHPYLRLASYASVNVQLASLVHRHDLAIRQKDHLDHTPDVVPHCLKLEVWLVDLDLLKGREGGRERGEGMSEVQVENFDVKKRC